MTDGWDAPLSNNRGFFTFHQWALRNKRADAGTQELENALQEAKQSSGDLTASEARGKVEAAEEPGDHPWVDIHALIDFETMEEKQRMTYELKRRIQEFEPQIRELLQMSKISKEEAADLLNLTPIERLTSKQKRAFQARISELERELEKTKKPPPTPQEKARAERREAMVGQISQDEVNLLFNTFSSIIARRTKREVFPKEIERFDELIATMQKVRPALKFVQARIQVENLARQLATVATSGRIVIRRGQARINALLEKMLREPLTEEEKEELERLQGRAPSPEIFGMEEVYYEPPRIKIIADDGPHPPTGGRPVEHGKEYPREMGTAWTKEIAELNAANFERKGFVVRIQTE